MQHWSLPLTANWIRFLQHQKESSHGLIGWGHCLRLLFLSQFCNAIPYSVWFLYERDETSFSQTCGMSFHWCLCSSVSKHNIPGAQIFQYLKLSTTFELHSPQFQLSCHFPDCYTLILSDKFFNFSFVFLCRDSLETNATRLIVDTSVPVFKVLKPSSETTGTHSAISMCTLQSC